MRSIRRNHPNIILCWLSVPLSSSALKRKPNFAILDTKVSSCQLRGEHRNGRLIYFLPCVRYTVTDGFDLLAGTPNVVDGDQGFRLDVDVFHRSEVGGRGLTIVARRQFLDRGGDESVLMKGA